MIADGRLLLRPLPELKSFRACTEAILFRDGEWQAELVVVSANVSINRHRHNRASSIDCLLAGSINAVVGSRQFATVNSGELARNLFPVPRGIWHGGSSGSCGAVYVSFQQWDGPPAFLSDDWEE